MSYIHYTLNVDIFFLAQLVSLKKNEIIRRLKKVAFFFKTIINPYSTKTKSKKCFICFLAFFQPPHTFEMSLTAQHTMHFS